MTRWTYETTLADIDSEDGGQALIADVPQAFEPPVSGDDGSFFIRLHSWDEAKRHVLMDELRGRRVRVTVETIE